MKNLNLNLRSSYKYEDELIEELAELLTPEFRVLEEIPVCENKKFLKKNYRKTYFENHINISTRECMVEKEGIWKKTYLISERISELVGELKGTLGALSQWGAYSRWSPNLAQKGFIEDMFKGNYSLRIPRLESRINHGRKEEDRILKEVKKLKSKIERFENIPKALRSWEVKKMVIDNRNIRTPKQTSERFIPTVKEYLECEETSSEAISLYEEKESSLNLESHEFWGVNNNPFAPDNSHQTIGEIMENLPESLDKHESKSDEIIEEETYEEEDLYDVIYYLDRLDSDYKELCEYNEDMFGSSEEAVTYTSNTRYPDLDELESIPKLNCYPGIPSHFLSWYKEEYLHFGEGNWNVILESPNNHSEEILHSLETKKRFMTKEEKDRMRIMRYSWESFGRVLTRN